jgi:hypothetical protein
MASKDEERIKTWGKRIDAAKELKKKWERKCRVQACYDYWAGDQLEQPYDEFGVRRAQVNLIHPEVRNQIPSLYFYRPFARLTAEPEHSDDPGSDVEGRSSLLQDTANHLIRDKDIGFREKTHLALKEAHWAVGCVEVGYSSEFTDDPTGDRPALKEEKDTKFDKGETQVGPLPVPDELFEMTAEIKRIKSNLKQERFYIKHITAKQILVSLSDKPCLEENDWIGYWEEWSIEDLKRSNYDNTKDLEANFQTPAEKERIENYNDKAGESEKTTVYKIWDLRTMTRYVMAEGHKKYLLKEPFTRCPLKFLRFDVDPYHFLPRPPIFPKLGPQDEYNQSREFMRLNRNARVARFTYDMDGIDPNQMKKLERGAIGIYVPRKNGAGPDVIAPVAQPNMNDSAMQTLTLSDKEFKQVGGVGGDARVSQESSATQAKIAATKDQTQDSFDRSIVADFLSAVVEELLALAIDNMNMDRWIAINVAPDSMYSMELAQQTAQQFEMINADKLNEESSGLNWGVSIDMESLSPVSEEEKFQKWMQALTLLGNPGMSRLFALSPELLKHTLDLMGIKSARDQEMIIQSMQKLMQMEMQMAAQGQGQGPGVTPQPGSQNPGTPRPPGGGGPQPVGPQGPGAS